MCTEYYSNNDHVDILIFGQGAGKVEERSHRPFVGPAGKRMRQIIAYMWKTFNFSVGFTNNVRCHPTNSTGKDRPPSIEEINFCTNHLRKDITQLEPIVVVPVGMSAFGTYYDTTSTTMARVHGNLLPLEGVANRLMPTYHPSYVIRKHGQGSWDEDDLKEMDQVIIADLEIALVEVRKYHNHVPTVA
jgi:DNA polymerase